MLAITVAKKDLEAAQNSYEASGAEIARIEEERALIRKAVENNEATFGILENNIQALHFAATALDEEIARLTKLDVHSLGKNRVNATLKNIQSFYDAFGVTEGAMFLPEAERVIIW